jgi:hypothetical protein
VPLLSTCVGEVPLHSTRVIALGLYIVIALGHSLLRLSVGRAGRHMVALARRWRHHDEARHGYRRHEPSGRA